MDKEKIDLIDFALKGINNDIKECETDIRNSHKDLQDLKSGNATKSSLNKLEIEQSIKQSSGRLEHLIDNKKELTAEKNNEKKKTFSMSNVKDMDKKIKAECKNKDRDITKKKEQSL